MTLTTIPQRRPRPALHSGNLGTPQVIQAMMNGSMPAYPRVGFHVASRAVPAWPHVLALPGEHAPPRTGPGPASRTCRQPGAAATREDVGGAGRRDTADDPRRDARLPAEEARSPQAVPEASFLLHTQEELAPRNLLDNTVRCLMPFLARGHHFPR
jgi:hypothetical protein